MSATTKHVRKNVRKKPGNVRLRDGFWQGRTAWCPEPDVTDITVLVSRSVGWFNALHPCTKKSSRRLPRQKPAPKMHKKSRSASKVDTRRLRGGSGGPGGGFRAVGSGLRVAGSATGVAGFTRGPGRGHRRGGRGCLCSGGSGCRWGRELLGSGRPGPGTGRAGDWGRWCGLGWCCNPPHVSGHLAWALSFLFLFPVVLVLRGVRELRVRDRRV